MAAKLLKLLEGVLSIFSKLPLKSLNNQADFDSAIRRFDPSRPSQPSTQPPGCARRCVRPAPDLSHWVHVVGEQRCIVAAAEDRACIDENGYGLRVPALVISPYARRGFVDDQILSFDAYAKFIEDDFLGGRRLDPLTDGRPDRRPDIRESMPQLGDLRRDFNFAHKPRRPLLLPTHPAPGPASHP